MGAQPDTIASFELRGTFGSNPSTLDPARIQTLPEWFTLAWLGVNLVSKPCDSALPGAATSWEKLENPKRVRFYLRDDVYDSLGNPMDATDWQATFDYLRAAGGPTHIPLSTIFLDGSFLIESTYIFSVAIRVPLLSVLEYLATPEFILISRAALKQVDAVDLGVSTGPYVVSKFTSSELFLTENRRSIRWVHGQASLVSLKPHLGEYHQLVSSVESGTFDFALTSWSNLRSQTATKVGSINFSINTAGYVALRSGGMLSNTGLRKQLFGILNQAAHAEPQSKVGSGLVPVGSEWSPAEKSTASESTSELLLPKALTIVVSSGGTESGLEEWIVGVLGRANIEFTLLRLTFADYQARRSELHEDLFVFKNGFDPTQPLSSLRLLLSPEYSSIDDPNSSCYDALTSAQFLPDQEQRSAFSKVSEQLLSEWRLVPIAFFGSTLLLRRGLEIEKTGEPTSNDEIRIESISRAIPDTHH